MNITENLKEGFVRGLASGLIAAALAGAGSYVGAKVQMEQMKMSTDENTKDIETERLERMMEVKELRSQLEAWKEKENTAHQADAEWRGGVKADLTAIKQQLSRLRR